MNTFESNQLRPKQDVVNEKLEMEITNSKKKLEELLEMLNVLRGTKHENMIEVLIKPMKDLQSYYESSIKLIKEHLGGKFDFQEQELDKIKIGFDQNVEFYKNIFSQIKSEKRIENK